MDYPSHGLEKNSNMYRMQQHGENVTRSKLSEAISPVLCSLHWLPVDSDNVQGLNFNDNSKHGSGPTYLQELIKEEISSLEEISSRSTDPISNSYNNTQSTSI